MVTPGAQRHEPGVGRKRFEYPHGPPYGRRPPARGEAGVSLLAETPVVPTPYSGETDGVLQRHGSKENDDDQTLGTEPRALDCCLSPPVGPNRSAHAHVSAGGSVGRAGLEPATDGL